MKKRPPVAPEDRPLHTKAAVKAVRLSLSGSGVTVQCTFSPKDAAWLVGLFTKRAMSQQ